MRRRYIQHMNDIQPSAAFVSRLELEMNRELRRTSRRQKAIPMVFTAATAAAVLIAIVFFGVIPSRHQPDVVSQPKNSAATFTPAPTDAPTQEPTVEPTAEPTVAASYPPEEKRLEIEMSDGEVFGVSPIVDDPVNVLLWDGTLIGANDSYLVEIMQSNELNSVVIAPLRPGAAYWPMSGDSNLVQLTDKKGNEVGHAEHVQFYDEETNTVKEGWKHTLYDGLMPPEVPENPVERVQMPGEVRADGTSLRYGRRADAPTIDVLDAGTLIGLGYRVGNWIHASTEPFCLDDEDPLAGWIHITEVYGLNWRTTLNHVDLLAQEVNLRSAPDGKIICTLSKDSALVYYGGATVPGKNGDWHYVSVNWSNKGTQAGYVSANYTKLNTFRLESELSLDGVVSATLSYSNTSPFGAAEQTIEGEKLALLLERLRGAYSEYVYTPVCGEGTANLTLTYADGREVVLPISGDSCTKVRYDAVTYDLKTDAERTERFLNDGGVGISDILSPIFDQIKIP